MGEERGSDGARVANGLAPGGVEFLINGEPSENRLSGGAGYDKLRGGVQVMADDNGSDGITVAKGGHTLIANVTRVIAFPGEAFIIDLELRADASAAAAWAWISCVWRLASWTSTWSRSSFGDTPCATRRSVSSTVSCIRSGDVARYPQPAGREAREAVEVHHQSQQRFDIGMPDAALRESQAEKHRAVAAARHLSGELL